MSDKKSKADRGLFRRRGSPHWWIRYSDKNGRIRRESTGTTEKRLAREILAKRKTLVAENRHLDVKKVPHTTFFELCKQYWELWGKHKRTKGLWNVIEIWKSAFGNVPVKELTQQRIEKFLADRMKAATEEGGEKPRRRFGAAARNRHLAMLNAMVNKGIEWGMVAENPAAKIERLRENGARTRFLDQEEIKRLLEAATDEFRPIVITALHTGMRRGEILNLKWEDVDTAGRVLNVRESKSKTRAIPIDETLYGALKVLPSRFQKGYVFPSPVKSGYKRVEFKGQFHGAVERAKLENVRFHDTRHSFASHLVMNGVDLKTVQELLGHTTTRMTERYSHLSPDHKARAVKILDSAYQTGTKTDTVENRASGESS